MSTADERPKTGSKNATPPVAPLPKTQPELNAKWLREQEALKVRHQAEKRELAAKQWAEQAKFTAELQGAAGTARAAAILEIEKRIDRLRPIAPGSVASWLTYRDRNVLRRFFLGQSGQERAHVQDWINAMEDKLKAETK